MFLQHFVLGGEADRSHRAFRSRIVLWRKPGRSTPKGWEGMHLANLRPDKRKPNSEELARAQKWNIFCGICGKTNLKTARGSPCVSTCKSVPMKCVVSCRGVNSKSLFQSAFFQSANIDRKEIFDRISLPSSCGLSGRCCKSPSSGSQVGLMLRTGIQHIMVQGCICPVQRLLEAKNLSQRIEDF